MLNCIADAFRRAFYRIRENTRAILKRIRCISLSRQNWARIGSYAALALLLCLLGAASYAYRNRDASQPQPKAALAVRTPSPTATPEPTPEPIRWVWPLEGEIVGAYSPDTPVWSGTLGQWQTHPGLDIAGSPGEAVYACRDGIVADAWSDRLWGNVIVLEHEDGYSSVYAGLNTLKLVSVGDAVTTGQIISAVGDSAACEAEKAWHIHFELKQDGEPVDFRTLVD